MQCDRIQHLAVILVEIAFVLVEHLGRANDAPFAILQRHTKDIARAVTRSLIDLRIEARIRVGIMNDNWLARRENTASNSAIAGKAYLGRHVTLRNPRE